MSPAEKDRQKFDRWFEDFSHRVDLLTESDESPRKIELERAAVKKNGQ